MVNGSGHTLYRQSRKKAFFPQLARGRKRKEREGKEKEKRRKEEKRERERKKGGKKEKKKEKKREKGKIHPAVQLKYQAAASFVLRNARYYVLLFSLHQL